AVYKIPPQGALANQRTACHKCFSLYRKDSLLSIPHPKARLNAEIYRTVG
ncbi:unnamed protein product, partial [Ectocarpus sp. 6 AP-2014]